MKDEGVEVWSIHGQSGGAAATPSGGRSSSPSNDHREQRRDVAHIGLVLQRNDNQLDVWRHVQPDCCGDERPDGSRWVHSGDRGDAGDCGWHGHRGIDSRQLLLRQRLYRMDVVGAVMKITRRFLLAGVSSFFALAKRAVAQMVDVTVTNSAEHRPLRPPIILPTYAQPVSSSPAATALTLSPTAPTVAHGADLRAFLPPARRFPYHRARRA